MKVFISSVRRGLATERDYLAELVKAQGHQPLRFEDFGAVDATSRGACLAGVDQADIYVLLLGPHYGNDMSDSGYSATAEEFNVAQQRGIPILVFRKTGIEMEPAQEEFATRVGAYADGRFWADFDDAASLALAVTKALQGVNGPRTPLAYMPLAEPVSIRWRSERSNLPGNRHATPTLEVHVARVGTGPLLPVSSLTGVSTTLATAARQSTFFGLGDALDINTDDAAAWAVRTSDNFRSHYGERSVDPYAGLVVSRDGSLLAFQALPTDGFGAVVSVEDLGQRLANLLRNLIPYLPSAENVTLAAAIDPSDNLSVGEPTHVGNRQQAIGWGHRQDVRTDAADQIALGALSEHLHDIAHELAVRLMNALRSSQR